MTERTEPGWSERLAGVGLRTVGRTSDCVRLGFERGFDSGEMMDAIYADRPSGRWLIGSLVDRVYLDQPGCRGLRGRKTLLLSTLERLIEEQRAAGRPPAIVDVAAGPATYLVELLGRDHGKDLTVLARDRDEHALDRGRRLTDGANLGGRIRYDWRDALDEDALVRLTPRPSVVIASGFYELLLDESVVARSMAIARRMLASGDPLVFTTQVAHPQVAMMAVVPAHDGRPWIIRNRPLRPSSRRLPGAGSTTAPRPWSRSGSFRSASPADDDQGAAGPGPASSHACRPVSHEGGVATTPPAARGTARGTPRQP
jgi:hypothetical protein